MQWHYYRNVRYLISHFRVFTKPIGYPTVYLHGSPQTHMGYHNNTYVLPAEVNSFPSRDTMWCHDGHGLSISQWELIMGSLILGAIL